jgi:Helix-turn-helix domain
MIGPSTKTIKNAAFGTRRDINPRFGVDPVIPLRDAAALLGVHPDTIKNQARRKKLSLIRISERRLGIRQSEFERYLCTCEMAEKPE